MAVQARNRDASAVPIGLHVASWVALFASVIAVNSVLADSGFVLGVMLMAAVGQALSIYMRKRQISSRLLEFTVFTVCIVAYLKTMATPYDIMAFHTNSADSPQIKFAALLAWMEALRSLTLTSNEAALFTGVPSIAIIGLAATDNVNPDIMLYFVIYLFCVTAMLCQCSQLRLRQYAAPDAPRLGTITQWQPAVVVTLLAFCIGGLVAWPLRTVAVRVIRSQVRQMAGISLPTPQYLRDSVESVSVLGGFASEGNREVLRVLASDACYLRGNVFDFYTSQQWVRSETTFHPPKPVDASSIPQNRRLVQTIRVMSRLPRELYGAAEPVEMRRLSGNRDEPGQPRVDRNGCWHTASPHPPGYTYRVVSMLPEISPMKLSRARGPYPQWVLEKCLQNPAVTAQNERPVYRLARQETRGCVNAYEKALAIESYLSHTFAYDLNAPSAPRGEDVVEYFLFKSKRGYCTAFASAMVMMLRELGIPARLAVGFAPGIYDSEAKAYIVRGKDRHAWVEVYFPDYGWIAFDPTGVEQARQPGFWTIFTRETRNAFQRLLTDRPWIILAAILSLITIYLAFPGLASRTLQLSRQPIADPAAYRMCLHYNAMCRLLARHGTARRNDQTPSEFADMLSERLHGHPEAAALIDEITRDFEAVKYGGLSPNHEYLDQAKRKVRALKSALWR